MHRRGRSVSPKRNAKVPKPAQPVRAAAPSGSGALRKSPRLAIHSNVTLGSSELDWSDSQKTGESLEILMPGSWDLLPVARIAKHVCHVTPQCASSTVEALRSSVDTLLRTVDFSGSASIIDMTAGDGALSFILRSEGLAVVSNNSTVGSDADCHYDAMQPASYERLRVEYGAHVIVACPLFELTDAILALTVMYARHFACCLVSRRYLVGRLRHPARHEWLQRLHSQGRLLVIAPAGSGGASDYVWLVVFANGDMGQRLMKRDTWRTG